jgi:hypothetical protein
MTYKILSIDVGMTNLGFIITHFNKNWTFDQIIYIKKINLMILKHRNDPKNCKIPHTLELSDRLDHFLSYYSNLFENIDYVLIERQPITGLTSIEQLLYSYFKYKSIVKLLSPISMHKWLKISDFTYEQRKVATVTFADKLLHNNTNWNELIRKHDIADALCFTWFFASKQRKKNILQASAIQNSEKVRSSNIKCTNNWFKQFAYNGNDHNGQ